MGWSGPVGLGNIGTFPICIRRNPGVSALPGKCLAGSFCPGTYGNDLPCVRIAIFNLSRTVLSFLSKSALFPPKIGFPS